jgi:class 3 adenylate cyclase
MNFSEILSEAITILQAEQRVSCRALKHRLHLSDDYLNDLKGEIVDAKRLAIEDNDGVLVWVGSAQPSGQQHVGTLIAESIWRERRQLTVMFCDLVDSTALSQRIDPEDLTQLIHKYYEHCATIVHHYDGFLAQYLGDGVLVYFGYPIAHENDAQRAI